MRMWGRTTREPRGLSLVVVLLTVLLSAFVAAPAAADGGSVSGVQEYYVPGTQKEMLDVFNQLLTDIYGAGKACVSTQTGTCVTPEMQGWEAYVESRVSIVAFADRSVVLLDDNVDLFASGYDPQDFDDVYDLDKGQVITFRQDRGVERPGQPTGLSDFALLGGDRVVTVGGPVLVMRASWPKWIKYPYGTGYGVSVGQVLADCVALYPTAVWSAQYGSPMGTTAVADALRVDDLTTKAIVQAKDAGTVVTLNGVPQNAVPLDRGQSLVLGSIPAGAVIGGTGAGGATKAISVALVTSGRERVDARFYNLTPQSLLDTSYVLPVNSMTNGTDRSLGVRLYLYAYEPLTYYVYQGTTAAPVAQGTLGGSLLTAVLPISGPTAVPTPALVGGQPGPENSTALAGALRVVASGRLQVLAAMDSDRADYDWGFPAVGTRHLVNEYYVPWAPGKGLNWPATNQGGYRGFGHPIHVSPAEDQTQIFVDWAPWSNADTPTSIVLNAGQWATLVDPYDGDNTGARIYSQRLSGGGEAQTGPPSGVPEGAFAVAWGEGILADKADGYDLGYGVLPQKDGFFTEPFLKIAKVAEPEEVAPGGEFTITLTLSSASAPIEDVTIADILPNEDFQYVWNSASVHLPDGTVVSPWNPQTADGLRLVWDFMGYDLPPHSQVVLTFTVKVDAAAEYGAPLPDTRLNNAEGYGKWCPLEGRPCFELKPTAFDNMRVVGLTGSIKVCKSVDWKGTTPVTTTTFKICVKPVGGTAEQCKDVDFDGGSVGFYGLAPGAWLVYEKAVMQGTTVVTTQWDVTGNNQTIQVPAACPWVYIKNTKKTGTPSIVINKVVDWGTATPDPTKKFTICVTGVYPTPTPAGSCQQVGYMGGPLTWYGLPNGTYKVMENPLPGTGWTVTPSSLTLTVPTACTGTIKNTLSPTLPGSLDVTKSVILNGASGTEVGATTFSICIQGPSYPTTPNCKTVGLTGGTLQWTNLKAGSYTVTETNPGSLWSVAITGSPASVPSGAKAYATVTNTRKKAALEVTKRVDWNGETPAFGAGFTLCIVGPSYPQPSLSNGGCQMVSFTQADWTDAGTGQKAVTWTNLVAGDYTVLEVPAPGWIVKVVDPPTGKVTVGATTLARAVVSNTRQRGGLEVTKEVLWNGATRDPNKAFVICVTGPAVSAASPSCQKVGPDGGTLSWPNLVPGVYTVTETDPGTGWTTTINPAQVTVPAGGETARSKVVNTYNPPTGKVTVHKVVRWNGHGPWGQSFEICLDKVVESTPTPVSCQTVGYAGGSVEWSNLPAGTYRVRETAPPEPWVVEQQTAPFVLPAGGQHTSTITNSYNRGRVAITKVANWNGPADPQQQFVICIVPVSNPSQEYCRSVAAGGTATWGDVPPGVYNVIEGPLGPEWEVVLPQPINVVPGDDYITATVTNTRRTGGLTVTKSVAWAGQAPPAPATFQICITGPSFPSGNCKTATFTAFSSSPAAQPLTWTNLLTGSYTVTEASPGSDWIVAVEGSPAVVSTSAPAGASVTNTYNPPPGKVTVHKVVKWNGHGPWGQSFEICLDKLVGSTPTPVGCQAVGYAGGTVEWNNLPPGTYRVQETAPPAPWKVEQQTAPFVLPAGGQHESTITNSYDRGRVKVTKVANWNGPVNPEQQFVICLAPASNPSEQYCRSVGAEGGEATWGDVPPGVYNVIEGPLGPEWEVVLPQPINVAPGDDYVTATVTNTRLTGSLTVTKSVVWAGQAPPAPASFQVCIAGPSYPSGNCKTATFTAFSSSPAAQPLTWTDLQAGSYTVTETNPGSAWIVAVEGSPATVSASAPGSASVTNTYNVGRITAVKTVDWNDYTPSPVQFEICLDSISGESPTRIGCQSVGQAGGSVEWNNLPAGTYRVVETTPPAPWTAQQATTPFPLPAGGQHTVNITNSYDAARLDITKVVEWNGPADPGQEFQVCIQGPSYPSGNCKTVDYDGGALTWTNLLPGGYTVSETPGPEWQVALPGSITVAAGNNTATVTNTRRTGGLTVTKSVTWTGQAPPAPASFQVCITGPSYPSGNCKTASFSAFSSSPAAQPLTWTNLQTGSYTVTETDPGSSWQVTITGSPAVVPSGGTAYAGVENRYVPPSCPVGPAPLNELVPKENNPIAECAAYGLVPVCKADIGGENTCGASLSFSTSGGSTTVSQLPPTARIFILKAGQYMIGIGYEAVPGTFANPEGKDLSHITVCGCPTP